MVDSALLRGVFWVPVLGLAIALIAELTRPDVLLVGNITIDIVEDARPTGGAVSYAAVLTKALGLRTCVVTVAGQDADLDIFAGQHLQTIPANSTLTFEHTYSWWGHARKLRVTANPNITVTRVHVSPWCRRARVVLLGPLTLHDLDAGSFLHPAGWLDRWLVGRQHIGLMGQGFQRRLDAEGRVLPLLQPSEQLLAGLGPAVSVFLSDVETDAWPPGDVAAVAAASQRLIITKGEQGADELAPDGSSTRIPPTPVAQAVDTNGAGDTFATAYMVALMRRDSNAAATASWAASRAVLQPQACKPRCAPALVTQPGGMRPMSLTERLRLAGGELGEVLVEQALAAASPLLRLGWAQELRKAVRKAVQARLSR